MELAFVTTRLAPFTGNDPIAEVNAALPKALRSFDHRALVIAPLFSGIDPKARSFARRLSGVAVTVDDTSYECELYDGRTNSGVELIFLGHAELFKPRRSFDLDATLGPRVFAASAIEVLDRQERPPGALHGFDWVGALALSSIRRHARLSSVPTILSIQSTDLATLPPGPSAALLHGIEAADRVTTLSPTHARELTRAAPMGEALASLGDRYSGLLAGIDTAVWNPATDASLTARFDPMDLRGKARCKAALQRELGLPVRDDLPLLGVLASGAADAGFDLLAEAGPRVLRNDCQIAVVFVADEEPSEVHASLGALAERYPDRIQVRKEDGTLSHEILGGSDLVLVPSKHEPCGFAQLAAHRYGALPIVHRTGSLADTVVDCDAQLKTGSGFVFDSATADDLTAAVRRAFSAFRLDAFDALRRRVMRIDHSWDRSARMYERLYREAAEQRAS